MAAVIDLVMSTPRKGKPATIMRSTVSLEAPFIAGVRKKLEAFIRHTIILSGKGVGIQFLMVQLVLNWKKRNAQLMTIGVQLIQPLMWASSLGRQTPGMFWMNFRPLSDRSLLHLAYGDRSPPWYTEAHWHWVDRPHQGLEYITIAGHRGVEATKRIAHLEERGKRHGSEKATVDFLL